VKKQEIELSVTSMNETLVSLKGLIHSHHFRLLRTAMWNSLFTKSSAVAERPRDAPCF